MSGRTPRGTPRFLRGTSAATGRTSRASGDLELRKLLRRFLDVCNAIDYAHSRGVLHRDIKPANIILGKHGETLVVDWGLAKATGKGDASTGERTIDADLGQRQRRDVAGLGHGHARLHEPRAGPRRDRPALAPGRMSTAWGRPSTACSPACRRSRERKSESILLAVQKGRIPAAPPARPTIDRTLEAVCLKAMALGRDRYARPGRWPMTSSGGWPTIR